MEDKKERVKKYLEDKYNLLFIFLILGVIITRLYFFFLTNNQPVWWDEAEYLLKAKSIAIGTPDTGWWDGRPVLFSLVLSIFYALGLGEISIRLGLIFISIMVGVLVYLVGKELSSKKVALITTILFSSIYLVLFYSVRIMVDIPSLFLGLLSFLFYIKGKKHRKLTWLIIPALVIATLIRFPSFLFCVILILYIIFVEEKWFKNRDYWISAIWGGIIFIPYLIWSYLKFGNPIYSILVGGSGALLTPEGGRFNVLNQYLKYFPNYTGGWLLFVFFVIGGWYLFRNLIVIDKIKVDNKVKSNFFIFIWMIIPIIYYGLFVNHFEDRYLLISLPAIFLLVGEGIGKASSFTEKYHRLLPSVILILVLSIGFYLMILNSYNIISERNTSYLPVKEAGLWLKQNSEKDAIILTKSHPQNTYYSEKRSYTFSNEEKDFIGNLSYFKPKYVIVSLFEKYPQWAYEINPINYNLTIEKVFPSQNNPQLIIYKTHFN